MTKYALERGNHQWKEILFQVVLNKITGNIQHQLAILELVQLDEGKRGLELLWGDIVLENPKALLPQYFWILFSFYHFSFDDSR